MITVNLVTQTTDLNPVESPYNSRGVISYAKMDERSEKSAELFQRAIITQNRRINEPKTASLTNARESRENLMFFKRAENPR